MTKRALIAIVDDESIRVPTATLNAGFNSLFSRSLSSDRVPAHLASRSQIATSKLVVVLDGNVTKLRGSDRSNVCTQSLVVGEQKRAPI